MAKDEDEDEDEAPRLPPLQPGQQRRYYIHVAGQVRGPYGVRLLRHFKDLSAELLAAPAGSQREKDWRPVAEYPELKAILEERAAVAKPKDTPPPKKGKPKRPPLRPLPEGPNYLLLFFLFILAAAGAVAFLVHRGAAPEAPPAAVAPSASGGEAQPTPEQMWPKPGVAGDQEAAEEQFLESYFPLLLTVKGVNAEQLPATCAAAKEFVATYGAYKGKYGGAQLDDLSQRLSATMRADIRTSQLSKVLIQAGSHGVDLTALNFPQQLRQNMQASDFSLQHALGNAQQLLSGVCAKR
jgi:hypothetical protein